MNNNKTSSQLQLTTKKISKADLLLVTAIVSKADLLLTTKEVPPTTLLLTTAIDSAKRFRLPKKLSTDKEYFEELGFIFIDIPNDEKFIDVILPMGWSLIENTSEECGDKTMLFLDNNGEVRGFVRNYSEEKYLASMNDKKSGLKNFINRFKGKKKNSETKEPNIETVIYIRTLVPKNLIASKTSKHYLKYYGGSIKKCLDNDNFYIAEFSPNCKLITSNDPYTTDVYYRYHNQKSASIHYDPTSKLSEETAYVKLYEETLIDINNIEPPKQIWEQMGFKFDNISNDSSICNLIAPNDWEVWVDYYNDNSAWYIYDGKGRKRGEIPRNIKRNRNSDLSELYSYYKINTFHEYKTYYIPQPFILLDIVTENRKVGTKLSFGNRNKTLFATASIQIIYEKNLVNIESKIFKESMSIQLDKINIDTLTYLFHEMTELYATLIFGELENSIINWDECEAFVNSNSYKEEMDILQMIDNIDNEDSEFYLTELLKLEDTLERFAKKYAHKS